MNTKLSKTLTSDLCEGCKRYCTIKELLSLAAFTDPRTVIQIKCVEIYKFERSKELDDDIGWEQAFKEWTEDGYALAFKDFYTELTEKEAVIHPRVIYNLTQGRVDAEKREREET